MHYRGLSGKKIGGLSFSLRLNYPVYLLFAKTKEAAELFHYIRITLCIYIILCQYNTAYLNNSSQNIFYGSVYKFLKFIVRRIFFPCFKFIFRLKFIHLLCYKGKRFHYSPFCISKLWHGLNPPVFSLQHQIAILCQR